MDAESRPRWQRLGQLLAARRAQIDPRYAVRKVFAAEVGVHAAVLRDIENAVRDNYTAPVLAAVEAAYRWEPGSIQRVLEGGAPAIVTPPGGFATWSEFPTVGIESRHGADTATIAESATARRVPSWFASEATRRYQHVESLTSALEQIRKIADHFGYTLGELLLNAGLASEDDLVIKERPTPPTESEALADFDEAAKRITGSPFLSSQGRKNLQRFIDEERSRIVEETRGER